MLTAQSQAISDRNGALPPGEDDPVAHARAQLTIIIDETVAAVLRNARENRRGALRALREAGFSAMADELEAGA